MRNFATLTAAAILSTALLAGCTAKSPEPEPTPTTTPAAAVPEEPIEPAKTQEAPPQGVVATGSFTSTDGLTSGTVSVHVTGTAAKVVVEDFASEHEKLGITISPSVQEGPCLYGFQYDRGDFTPPRMPEMGFHPTMFHGDWTAIKEIDLILYQDWPGADPECIHTIVARVPLTWTMKPLRPWLAIVSDGGSQQGATGIVETAEDGSRSYTVATEDGFDGVTRRFGISTDDLFYLNETQMRPSVDVQLEVGQVLNLSLDKR